MFQRIQLIIIQHRISAKPLPESAMTKTFDAAKQQLI